MSAAPSYRSTVSALAFGQIVCWAALYCAFSSFVLPMQRALGWLLTASFTCYSFAAAALWAHLMPAFAAKGHREAQALSVVVWFGPAQVAGRLLHFIFARAAAGAARLSGDAAGAERGRRRGADRVRAGAAAFANGRAQGRRSSVSRSFSRFI